MRLWLQIATIVLVLANAAMLYLYLAPPGGSRSELQAENSGLRSQILAANQTAGRLQTNSTKVQAGRAQSSQFTERYFLTQRLAYDAVISELQRMARESGLQQKEASFGEEPIEGSNDLSVLNIKANFQGKYDSLMKFLNEVDHSQLLLMLDTLQASPQQHGGEINTSITFQAVIREDSALLRGVQQ
ncbi:MAG: hypothetical protein JO061_09305 [Acidobacteriaceae bacterium]|nr:hypothetical protein [Acidobacteriaceae bacterium]